MATAAAATAAARLDRRAVTEENADGRRPPPESETGEAAGMARGHQPGLAQSHGRRGAGRRVPPVAQALAVGAVLPARARPRLPAAHPTSAGHPLLRHPPAA